MVKATGRAGSADLTSQKDSITLGNLTAEYSTTSYLTEKGDVLVTEDNKKKTPLQRAVENCEKERAKELLGDGASLTETDSHGNSLLHIALAAGHHEMARYLLQFLHDCNFSNEDGVTPMHLIAECGKQVKLAKKFIVAGAKVNVADKMGRTPLMLACKRGYSSMVSLLLRHGSNPHSKDANGWTAAAYASVMGYNHIVDMVSRYSGKNVTFPGENEESSTDEEEPLSICKRRIFRKGQRIIPTKILRKKGKKREVTDTKVETKAIYDSKGNLKSIPEVLEILQTSSNNVSCINQWVLQQQEMARIKDEKCKELERNIEILLQERDELLRIQEEHVNKLTTLLAVLEDAPGKKEKAAMEEQLAILNKGVSDLECEHRKVVKEVEELTAQLEEECEVQRTTILNLEEKMELLIKDKEKIEENFEMTQNKFRAIIEDLDINLKRANEIEENLKLLLRVTYDLLQENLLLTKKLLDDMEFQMNVTNKEKRILNVAKDESLKVGKILGQIVTLMMAMNKLLKKLQNQLENHALVKQLIDEGVIDGGSGKEDGKNKLKRLRRRKEEKEEKSEEGFDPTGVMSLPTHTPAVCCSKVEAVRFEWVDPPAEHELARRISTVSEDSSPLENYFPESISHLESYMDSMAQLESNVDSKTSLDEPIPPELRDKLEKITARFGNQKS